MGIWLCFGINGRWNLGINRTKAWKAVPVAITRNYWRRSEFETFPESPEIISMRMFNDEFNNVIIG